MQKNHLFNLLIATALVIVVALTFREAAATASLISQGDSAKAVECASLPSRYSIHTKPVGEISVLYTEDGPTGVDGGLVELLSGYRTCSK
jgi:hypothetical protein